MVDTANENLLVGLDIGTSKVVAIVASCTVDGALHILGIGSQPCHGLKRGVVVNIESTVYAIERAVEEAELMANCKINSVTVSIAGNHISSRDSHGIVAIQEGEVASSDLDRVIDAAGAVAIPADQKILHILPQEYVIDYQGGIREPLGMSGVRLEAKVHLVTGALNAAQNIAKCVGRCNLKVDRLVLGQLASSYAVLTDDEKELGVCMIDIGGGTTDIAVFSGGAIRYTAVIPIAGDQITNDIAMALRTPTMHAEQIKVRYACALTQMTDAEEIIKVPSVGDRPPRELSRLALADVVQPRYEELYELVHEELHRSGFADLIAAGVVMTGGTAMMEGAVELAEEIFHVPVRLARPEEVSGLSELLQNPVYSCAVGLLHYARQEQLEVRNSVNEGMRFGASVLISLKDWIRRNF